LKKKNYNSSKKSEAKKALDVVEEECPVKRKDSGPSNDKSA
jgi:hypothetical protein